MPNVGDTAPDFTLPDEEGREHTLSDCRGQKVVVFFYPKDGTTGCTKEACSFRDSYAAYEKHNIKVFGISNDGVDSHRKFKDKYDLTHTLLADPENTVPPLYDAYGKKKIFGNETEGIKRTTYLLDEEGEIVKIFKKVKTEVHAEEVLEAYGLSG